MALSNLIYRTHGSKKLKQGMLSNLRLKVQTYRLRVCVSATAWQAVLYHTSFITSSGPYALTLVSYHYRHH